MLQILAWCLAASIAIYLLAVGIMVFRQRSLLYRPLPAPADPQSAGVTWMRRVERNGRLQGWFAPPPSPDAPILVFFHGNRGTLARVAAKTTPWRDAGVGVFAATYRGYEGNPGHPSEAGLYEDGRAALDWLSQAGFSAAQLILYGESLGTGIVTQLATERTCRGVILEAPFSSMTEIAAGRYPWLPCRWLLRDRFDNLSKIGDITVPLMILHGARDRTVPLVHARRLAAAAPEARLVVLEEADHLNLYESGGMAPLLSFIKDL
ncbi:alpha/beta hydrolase [Telmatospirillum siberiense]|uniref:alpha/beta hydrolase n=1 Tax=Telmatospirillum siberiense TaxID=382514 RepID=UPI0013040B72|nr:alpha/beta hydrolase [Telmatospirillum siberiense]